MAAYVLAPGSASTKSIIPARLFFWALALATAAPLFWLSFGMALFHETLGPGFVPFFLATTIGHVGTTAFVYFDREMRPLIEQNQKRFFLWPLLAAVGCLVAYGVSARLWSVVLIINLAWLLYHYQRQNYGLIAFAAQSAGAGKLPPEMTWMLNLSAAAAIIKLGLGSSLGVALGGLAFVAASALLVKMLPRLVRRDNTFVLIFTVLGWAFFLPALISDRPIANFWSYALAHGAQYLIFMTVLAGNTKRGAIDIGLFLVASLLGITVLGSLYVPGSPQIGPAVAVYTGLVMGHFLIDAKVWRLREPLQRQIVGERFGFIFPR
jgi:hypothetical protein